MSKTKAQWYTVHVRQSPERNLEERCVVVLKPFSKPQMMSFGKVKTGTCKVGVVYVQNPLGEKQIVNIIKFPWDKNFSIDLTEFEIEPNAEKELKVTWEPTKALSCRETVVFQTNVGFRIHSYLHGVAVSSVQKKKGKLHAKGIKTRMHTFENIRKKSVSVEDNKENVNVDTLGQFSLSKSTNAFFLRDHVPVESPVRRQTYLINSFFKDKTSEITNVPQITGSEGNVTSVETEELQKSNKINFNACSVDARRETYAKNNTEVSIQNTCATLSPLVSIPNASLVSSMDVSCYSQAYSTPYPLQSLLQNLKCQKSEILYETPLKTELTSVSKILDECAESGNLSCPDDTNFNASFTSMDFTKFESETKHKSISADISFGDSKLEPSMLSFYELNTRNPKPIYELKSYLEASDLSAYSNITDANPYLNSPDMLKTDALLNNFTPGLSESVLSWKYIHDSTLEAMQDSEVTNLQINNSVMENSPVPKTNSPPVQKQNACFWFEISPSKNLPTKECAGREFFNQIDSKKFRCKAKCRTPSPKKKISPKRSNLKKYKSPRLKNKSQSVASKNGQRKYPRALPRKLNLFKLDNKEVVSHPNPFAAKNRFYDERWMEKQELAFTRWLNFILTPMESFQATDDTKVDAAKLWIESMKDNVPVRAPTKDDVSLKAYTATKQLNELRKAACDLYESEEVAKVVKKIEEAVELKKILVRKDRATHADLGIKQYLLELLLSYNCLWLRIGLETIYGEVINIQANSYVIGLSRFIIKRFLTNPDICAKYAHPAVLNFYKPGYDEEMKKFILRKFLILVFFLDRAKSKRLIRHDPCLFARNSNHKSSRELLLIFSREYLSGEGDITRHLRYLGCTISHQQSYLEEFDYAVTNIAIDLRCGLRLARVVELIIQEWSIENSLRINTFSRLPKIHNNEVTLKALRKAGIEIEDDIQAKDIVDGHREKTLSLLWQIIFKTQISKLLDKVILKKEIAYLSSSLQLRADIAAFNALRCLGKLGSESEISSFDSTLYRNNELLQLLLLWCQYVCAHYNVKANNFTTSFSDGRILCLLLHHYLPGILPYDSIKQETTTSYFEADELQSTIESDGLVQNDVKDNSKLLRNEKDNLKLAFEKFQEIGQIPVLSCPTDLSNTIPDEKVVITIVAYTNSCLMSLSKEIRAARTIQLAWRKYVLKNKHEYFKVEIAAATLIQKQIRGFVQRKRLQKWHRAALVIQTSWRMYAARLIVLNLRQRKWTDFLNKKANVIQAAYRGYACRKQMIAYRQAAVIVQSHVRKFIARSQYLRAKKLICHVQDKYRSKLIARIKRQKYIKMRDLVVRLQAMIRGKMVRKELKKKHSAACKIQAAVKMWLARKKYVALRNATIFIQNKLRATLLMERCQRDYKTLKNAAVIIQRWYVSKKLCQLYLKKRESSILIQKLWRGYIVRKTKKIQNEAAAKIQQKYKSWKCRQQFLQQRKACIIIQEYYRSHRIAVAVRNQFLKKKSVAIYIQYMFRKKRQFEKKNIAAIKIQAWYRGVLVRKALKLQIEAAVKIQRRYKTWKCQRLFLQMQKSCISIQKYYRAHRIAVATRNQFLKEKSAVIFIQYMFRKKLKFQKKNHAAIKVQSWFRGIVVRNALKVQNEAASKIQWKYKSWKSRQLFLQLQKSSIVIQRYYRAYRCAIAVRSQYLKEKSAAIYIQYLFRKYLKHKRSAAAVQIQSWYRGAVVRKAVKTQNEAGVKIQRKYKSWKSRQLFLQLRKSSIVIQRHYRAYRCAIPVRNQYLKLKTAAIYIQYVFRKNLKHKQNAAAIKIQSWYRGTVARKALKVQNEAAIKIQRKFKSWKCRRSFLQLQKSCVVIQNYYRSHCIAVAAQNQYLKQRSAAIYIQYMFRKYLNHKQTIAAIKIQSWYRGVAARREYEKQKFLWKTKNSIKIQCFVRRVLAYKLLKKHKCAKKIQAWYRSRSQQAHYNLMRTKIITIQAAYKGYIARKQFLEQKQAVIAIQSLWRMYSARRKFNLYLQNREKAAKCIQHRYRAYKQRCRFIIQISMITKIQSLIRGYITRKEIAKQQKQHLAAIIIQTYIRGFMAKKQLQRLKDKQVTIDKLRRYVLYNMKAIIIQRCYRQYRFRKHAALNENYAIVIQRWWKAHKCRQQFLKLRCCVTKFQATARSYLQRRTNAAIVLQSYVRRWLVRREMQRLRNAAVKIQAVYRAHVVRRSLKNKVLDKLRDNIRKAKSSECMCLGSRTSRAMVSLKTMKMHSILSALENLDVCTRLSPKCCETFVETGGILLILDMVNSCNRSVPHMEVIKFSVNILLNIAKHNKTVDAIWNEPGSLDVVLNLMKVFREKGASIFTKCCSLLWILCLNPVKAEAIKNNSNIVGQLSSLQYLLERKKQMVEKRSSGNPNASLSSLHTSLFNGPRESMQIQPDWMLGRQKMREFGDTLVAINALMKLLELKKKVVPGTNFV